MRHAIPIALGAALLVAPAAADDSLPGDAPGLPDRIERALRDMMREVQPTLEGALDYMRSLGAIDDPLNYELPEILPNGDVIIRRRPDAPAYRPEPPDAPGTPPEPDLPHDLPQDPEAGIRT